MTALPALARASRYGDVRGTDTAALRVIADRLLARVCAGLPSAAHGLDDPAAATLCANVDAVHEATGLLGGDARERWLNTLATLISRPLPPRVGGRLTRLLLDARRLAAADVAPALSRALTPGTPPVDAAGYVEGFLTGGALLLVHDEKLLRLIDTWLAGIAADSFTDVLPLLRRTFGAFASPERRAIAQRAAALTGPVSVAENTDDLDFERGNAALDVIATLLGVGR
ncbi:MAG TPA: DUF5682 family protein [Pseudonocardiaceae bacterium]